MRWPSLTLPHGKVARLQTAHWQGTAATLGECWESDAQQAAARQAQIAAQGAALCTMWEVVLYNTMPWNVNACHARQAMHHHRGVPCRAVCHMGEQTRHAVRQGCIQRELGSSALHWVVAEWHRASIEAREASKGRA